MFAAACAAPHRGHGDDDGVVDSPTGTAEICTDGIDNDNDGRVDCSDPDCSGIDGCPVCGQVENPLGQPLALPDGQSSGTVCSTDTQCVGTNDGAMPPHMTPNCVYKECHASYTSTLNFIGFPMGAKLDDTSKLVKVCAKLEHSWIRDLQVELITPNGVILPMLKFMGRDGGEIYLGQANDADSDSMPVPGVGYKYCWSDMAPTTMLNTTMQNFNGHQVVPEGDYKPDVPFTALQGADLNGMWTFRVTDLWGIDNGYLFEWSISFDPTLVTDCSGPIIE
jgi:hypothetical protein